jgi:hypothetical protein
MNQPIVELEVSNIRRKKNPDRFNVDQWKKHLPQDVQKCPNVLLLLSMAYGDDSQQITPVLQAKMNITQSNTNPTDTSLDNLKEPLQKLQRDLDDNSSSNLFRAVRSVDNGDIDVNFSSK